MMQERRSLKEPKWDDQGFGDVVIFLSFQSLTLVENIVGMALLSLHFPRDAKVVKVTAPQLFFLKLFFRQVLKLRVGVVSFGKLICYSF